MFEIKKFLFSTIWADQIKFGQQIYLDLIYELEYFLHPPTAWSLSTARSSPTAFS